MKYLIYIIPAMFVVVAVSIFTVQNVEVQVVHSISEEANVIDKKELVKAIKELPPELKSIQLELNAMVAEIDETLEEVWINQPLDIKDHKSKAILNQSIEVMYKQAGLDYVKEESRIQEAFETASSDPETLFTK